jgi:hypothetical protein
MSSLLWKKVLLDAGP